MQLAQLASQHHASDYNRSKFGPHGCPVPYFPLSIHLPDHFHQLRARQLELAHAQAWWPSPAHSLLQHSLHDQLMAAISEPLNISTLQPQPSVKTSLTHPINISFIIPPELIALISSHALLASSVHSPTLLEIPSSFTLDRLSTLRDAHHQSMPPPAPFSLLPKHSPSNLFRTRSDISDALQAAINSDIDSVAQTADCTEAKLVDQSFFGPATTVSLSLSMKTIAAPLTLNRSQIPESPLARPLRSLLSNGVVEPMPAPLYPSWSPELVNPNTLFQSQNTHFPSAFTIGNLYLSSCPGKKLRLDGPVKGRSGVCRDLETDMMRMKQLGVSCIVCCLDDSELEFLGAPWPEYERCAKKKNIDILRLPTPEGLPPISASHLDEYLVDLINRYSLRGIPILVHCRGGVGRAGVIACCWMIRLGLCGWADDSCKSSPMDVRKDETLSNDTLSFVEKVIALVRRRRSMKAVETYEQVKFLVDYVDHLRGGWQAA